MQGGDNMAKDRMDSPAVLALADGLAYQTAGEGERKKNTPNK